MAWWTAPARATDSRPEASFLLAQVRAALPTVPLLLEGELQARDRRGNITRVAPLEMEINWGGPSPQVVFTLYDRFGEMQERVVQTWPAKGQVRFELKRGDPPEPVAADEVAVPIRGLDITWWDLSLAFLWWEGGRWIGSERVRGRYCHIIEIDVPPGADSPYRTVRVWIDPEVRLLMQADALDQRGRPVRRVQVRSLRKIDEVWMVQNLDIVNHVTRERVTLRVRNVEIMPEER